VIVLLDEQLDTPQATVTHALNSFHLRSGLSFKSLRTETRGLLDPDIPAYCKRENIVALVSFNHKDFGKKIPLYRELIAQGISVVVLRPPPVPAFTPERQAALILLHMRCIETHLNDVTAGPILLRLSPSECRRRELADLQAEFEGGTRKLP